MKPYIVAVDSSISVRDTDAYRLIKQFVNVRIDELFLAIERQGGILRVLVITNLSNPGKAYLNVTNGDLWPMIKEGVFYGLQLKNSGDTVGVQIRSSSTRAIGVSTFEIIPRNVALVEKVLESLLDGVVQWLLRLEQVSEIFSNVR